MSTTKNLLKYSAQAVVNIALGYEDDPFKYSLQKAFNLILGETNLTKYTFQQALQLLTGRTGTEQHILNAIISESNSPVKYSVQAALNYLNGYVFPDDQNLEVFLNDIDGCTIEDSKGRDNDAAIIHPCYNWLADTTLTLDSAVPAGTTITEINGSAVTTGYSMNTTTISVDFSELPVKKFWKLKLSTGSEYYPTNSARIYDHSGTGNHLTNNGTLATHWEVSEQNTINIFGSYGFNKYFWNKTNASKTISFGGVDYTLTAYNKLRIPDALLQIKGFSLSDMTGNTSDVQIVNVPENRASLGNDVYGDTIRYTQSGNVILASEGAIIDLDPEDGEADAVQIWNRDNIEGEATELYKEEIQDLSDYDATNPYRWSVKNLLGLEQFALQLRAGKLINFIQTVTASSIPIGIKKALVYASQRLSGSDADTTTIGRISTVLSDTNPVTMGTAYDSDNYFDMTVRNAVLNQSGVRANLGYKNDNILLNGTFETNTDNWSGTSATLTVETSSPLTGLGSLKVTQTNAGGGALQTLSSNLAVGTRLLLYAKIKIVSGETGNIAIRFRNINGDSYYPLLFENVTVGETRSGYAVYTVTGSYAINRVLTWKGTASNVYLFDDMQIYVIGDTVSEVIDLAGNTSLTQATATKQGYLTSSGLKFFSNSEYTIADTTGKTVKINGETVSLDSPTKITYTDLQDELTTDTISSIQILGA